jgi:hypothetical protein
MSHPSLYDLFRRIDTTHLYQPFAERAYDVFGTLLADGVLYYATAGLRTFDEQTPCT